MLPVLESQAFLPEALAGVPEPFINPVACHAYNHTGRAISASTAEL